MKNFFRRLFCRHCWRVCDTLDPNKCWTFRCYKCDFTRKELFGEKIKKKVDRDGFWFFLSMGFVCLQASFVKYVFLVNDFGYWVNALCVTGALVCALYSCKSDGESEEVYDWLSCYRPDLLMNIRCDLKR